MGFFLCPTCILSGGNIRHFIDAGEIAGFEHTNSASVSTEPSSGKNQEFEDEKKKYYCYIQTGKDPSIDTFSL